MNRDWIPMVAGVLQIVTAVCSFVGAGAVAFSVAIINTVPEVRDEDVPVELLTWVLGSLTVFLSLLALVGLIGGVFAVRRRGFGWALAGSIASIFTAMPLGVAALILVLVGEREFTDRPPVAAST